MVEEARHVFDALADVAPELRGRVSEDVDAALRELGLAEVAAEVQVEALRADVEEALAGVRLQQVAAMRVLIALQQQVSDQAAITDALSGQVGEKQRRIESLGGPRRSWAELRGSWSLTRIGVGGDVDPAAAIDHAEAVARQLLAEVVPAAVS